MKRFAKVPLVAALVIALMLTEPLFPWWVFLLAGWFGLSIGLFHMIRRGVEYEDDPRFEQWPPCLCEHCQHDD